MFWESKIIMLRTFQGFLMVSTSRRIGVRGKRVVDKSLIPEIKETEIEEHFVRSGGPGGQKVNKTSNCVHLFHKPTGINVKVQDSRLQSQNRKIARERLTLAIDKFINGENSIESQKKNIDKEKLIRKIQKQKKLAEMKRKWRELNCK